MYQVEDQKEKARDVLLQLLKRNPEHEQAQKMLDALGR
jgi:TolA-binding protein